MFKSGDQVGSWNGSSRRSMPKAMAVLADGLRRPDVTLLLLKMLPYETTPDAIAAFKAKGLDPVVR
jgi:hypothetical protein